MVNDVQFVSQPHWTRKQREKGRETAIDHLLFTSPRSQVLL